MGKFEAFLICVTLFLRLEEFLLENNTEYNFCVFNNLQFKRDRENNCIAKITGYTVYARIHKLFIRKIGQVKMIHIQAVNDLERA